MIQLMLDQVIVLNLILNISPVYIVYKMHACF